MINVFSNTASIITYHFFSRDNSTGCTCSVQNLEKHLAILSTSYSVLPLFDLLTALENNELLPSNTVCIMLDDGDQSFYKYAWPLFKAYNIPLHINLTCAFIGQQDLSYPSNTIMSYHQIEDLLKTDLVSLGSHSMTHKKMDSLTVEELKHEIFESQKIIANIQGDCITFTYPYGDHRYVTRHSELLLLEAGYRYAFTTTSGLLKKGVDRYRIGRCSVLGHVNAKKFKFMASGFHSFLRQFKDKITGKKFYNQLSPGGRIGQN